MSVNRTVFSKTIRAKTYQTAARQFAKHLQSKGHAYEWAAIEVVETVSNGYYCCSDATRHTLIQYHNEATYPSTHDWSYYWAIEPIDEGKYYAWFIEENQ